MRVFLGIEMSPSAKEQITAYVKSLQKNQKGWMKEHDYHLTLLFIGDVEDGDISAIQKRMELFSLFPFSIELAGPQFFQSRILYLSVKSSPELMEMKQRVDEWFSEWVKRGEKPFVPHLTIKRWQRYEFNELQAGIAQNPFHPIAAEVNSLVLFKSEKDQDENKYHIIYRTKIG